MKPDSLTDIEAVARDAARNYGQEFDALPPHSQAYWSDLVRELNVGKEQTAAEHAAAQALAAWSEKRDTAELPEPEAEPAEKKIRNKKS